MDKKSYAEILKFAMNTQIDYINEELENVSCFTPYDRERYLEGIIRGLEIAIEKIDASMFLVEK